MSSRNQIRSSSGFTLVETMIAILVLSFGVLTLAAVYMQGMVHMATSQSEIIAKEKAAEAIESVFTSRDTRVIQWDQIRNVGAPGGTGIFLTGPRPLNDPGADGLINTVDDGSLQYITSPGPDNLLGTADDVRIQLKGFTREIQITDIAPNLRQVRVIVSYMVGPITRQIVLATYISSFA